MENSNEQVRIFFKNLVKVLALFLSCILAIAITVLAGALLPSKGSPVQSNRLLAGGLITTLADGHACMA